MTHKFTFAVGDRVPDGTTTGSHKLIPERDIRAYLFPVSVRPVTAESPNVTSPRDRHPRYRRLVLQVEVVGDEHDQGGGRSGLEVEGSPQDAVIRDHCVKPPEYFPRVRVAMFRPEAHFALDRHPGSEVAPVPQSLESPHGTFGCLPHVGRSPAILQSVQLSKDRRN